MTTVEERLHLLETIDLKQGGHDPDGGEYCAMEAAAFIAGEPHSDHPTCVCPVIAAFLRSWNDRLQSDEERNRWLKPLIPAVLNTASTLETQVRRAFLCADFAVRSMAPKALDAAAAALEAAGIADHPQKLRDQVAALRALAPVTNAESARSAARSAWSARSLAESAAESAWSARSAESAAEAAARSAESAWSAAARSAWSAESAARSAWSAESAAESAARSAARSAESAARSATINQETQDFVRRLVETDHAA